MEFWVGLSEGAEDRRILWNKLVAQLGATPPEKQNVTVMRGFLNALHLENPDVSKTLLDEAVNRNELAFWYPILQTAVPIDGAAVERLIRSLNEQRAPIRMYETLVFGGVTHPICGRDFNRLLARIATEPDGVDVAIHILTCGSRLKKAGETARTKLITIGCDLMRRIRFARHNDLYNYRLGIVAKQTLVGEEGVATVREICSNLKEAVSKWRPTRGTTLTC